MKNSARLVQPAGSALRVAASGSAGPVSPMFRAGVPLTEVEAELVRTAPLFGDAYKGGNLAESEYWRGYRDALRGLITAERCEEARARNDPAERLP